MLLAGFSFVDFLTNVAISPSYDPDSSYGKIMGLPAWFVLMFGEVSHDAMSQLKSMPLLVLVAQVCPAKIEGTLFAFIMGMNNTGSSYSGYFGGWLNNYLGLTLRDFVGTGTANFLRVFFKLTPCHTSGV